MNRDWNAAFERDGFALLPGLLQSEAIVTLIDSFDRARESGGAVSVRDGSVFGMRHLLQEIPEVASLCLNPLVRQPIQAILGARAFPVRALFFDKTPDANWHVPWHQDRTIAVRERIDLPDFGPWSVKGGVAHVQPPPAVLQKMVALRLHLDDCGNKNGPLRVLAGTHGGERWTDEQIADLRQRVPETVCLAERGEGLLMRPLLLHASGAVTGSAFHRRVLHIEWAAEPLPGGLKWCSPVADC